MTVRDAIQSVLSQYETGLTCQEITTQILKITSTTLILQIQKQL